MKSFLTTLMKVLFALALIYWLINSGKVDFQQLKLLINPATVLGCIAIIALNLYLAALRWYGLLKSQNIPGTVWDTLKLTLIGVFFNFVVPGGVGGDVVKAYYVAKENKDVRLKSVITIAMDRLLGLFTMLVMALFVMLWDFQTVTSSKQLSAIMAFLSVIFAGYMFFWSFIYSRRLHDNGWIQSLISKLPLAQKLEKLYVSFAVYREHKETFFKALLISLTAQIIAILFFVFTARQLGYSSISFHTFFFVVPIGFMVTAVPIAPGGVGVGQAAFLFLFGLALHNQTAVQTGLGDLAQVGALTVTAFQIFNFAFGLIGAFFYVSMGRKVHIPSQTSV